MTAFPSGLPTARRQALALTTCMALGCGGVTLPQYELTVHGGGDGNGALTSDPTGINCSITADVASDDCRALYDEGTPVMLTAVSDARSTFEGWAGGCDSTGPCRVTMSAGLDVTATFELRRLELMVDATGTGDGGVTSDPSGLDCTITAGVAGTVCTAPFAVGGTVTLTATAGAGSTFDGWSGACTGGGPCQVIISAIDTVTATFTSFCALTTPGDADGDRLPDCAETNTNVFVAALDAGTDPNNPDTDGDGILDGDEALGTLLGLDLPLMGVNPLRQDILIEYDWFSDALECGTHSHRPTPESLTMVTTAFGNAPVQNPDGSTGINFIHDYGQGGAFTGGNSVADVDGVLTGGVNNAEFQSYKIANFASNRHGYFHYTLLPHRYNTNSGSSGQAEFPGDDMIVSLYCARSDQNVANTIMHELGHNLNLHHGGATGLNWKPNYNSVMNYKYQFAGVDGNCSPPGDGILDYSRGTRITLDENDLDETQGICGSPGWDWNGDGDAVDMGFAWDINVDGVITDNRFDILTDHDDWAAVFFGGLFDGDGAPVLAKQIISCTLPAPTETR